jgi:hypothetical protein
MGVTTSEVGYTSATTGRGDHEVHKGHVVALGEEKKTLYNNCSKISAYLFKLESIVCLVLHLQVSRCDFLQLAAAYLLVTAIAKIRNGVKSI